MGLTCIADGDRVTSKLCATEHTPRGGDLHGIATFALTKQKELSMVPTRLFRFVGTLHILVALLPVCGLQLYGQRLVKE